MHFVFNLFMDPNNQRKRDQIRNDTEIQKDKEDRTSYKANIGFKKRRASIYFSIVTI